MFEFAQLKELSEEHESRFWPSDFLTRHHLHGFAYNKTQDKSFYVEWKKQLTRNLIVKAELEKIGKDIQLAALDICLLKGYSLMGDIYEDWGQRFASDIDLLVSLPNLWQLTDILQLNGFHKVAEEKWLKNRFKFMFSKTVNESEIIIEVHTQLFWHTQIDWREDALQGQLPGFKNLGLEKQLLHLCGHLGFQHTFLKLFWLMDVFFFLKSHGAKIHWRRYWNLARQHSLYKSSYLTFYLCKQLGASTVPIFATAPHCYSQSVSLLAKLVDFQFLYDPKRSWWKYLLVKILIKDSLFLNVIYGYNWLLQKWASRKR